MYDSVPVCFSYITRNLGSCAASSDVRHWFYKVFDAIIATYSMFKGLPKRPQWYQSIKTTLGRPVSW